MVNKDKIEKLLFLLGFERISKNLFRKVYKQHNNYAIEVDLDEGKINYNGVETEDEKVKPQGKILIGEKTTSNLHQPENLVVLECVNRLLEKGYEPQHLHLEKKWKLGRTGKGGRADIIVYEREPDAEGFLKPLMIIECKTWGKEFEKEKRKLKANGGQLFSYLQQERDAKYLVLYTSDVFESEDGEFIDYDNIIIKVIDDLKKVEDCKKENEKTGKERPCSYKDAPTKEDLHNVWKRLYRAYWHKHGIFDKDALPYNIELKPLKKKDLIELGNAQGLFNKFAEILRHNNISDNANAFNKMLNLILCKLVDEEEKLDEEELDFQVKGDEEYEKLVDRLQRLYKEGMVRYLDIKDFVYHSDEEIEDLIKVYPERANLEEVLKLFREIKYYTNNEFAFKEIHNKRLFDENAEILIEVIELIQNYRFRNSKNYHILGDFFELLLDFGVKQSEGQFFTPIPIVQFINGSLNPKRIVEFKLSHDRYKHNPIPKFLDYACGAGHFLTDIIEKIRELIKEFPELRAYIKENPKWERDFIFGIEKDYRLARTAKIACFLANDGDANVIYGDGLDEHEALRLNEEKFDLIATNPPYSIRKFKKYLDVKTEFELLKYLSEDAKEIEVLFIERAKQVLKEKSGRIGIILPSSILSNSGIYEKAREIILKHFEIKGIVEIGSNAFIATGTNTVILFMKRRDDKFVKDREKIAKEIFSGQYFTDERVKRDYIDALKLLGKFLEFRELPRDDYLKFLKDGILTDKLLNTEMFKDYQKHFEERIKKDKEIKKLRGKKREEKIKKKFLEYLKEKEKEKFFYFLLTFLDGEEPNDERFYTFQKVFVVRAPEKKEEQKKFLGYEFSKRRGYEGIIIHKDENGKMTTKLYDPENYDNPTKVSAYIRKSFDDDYLDVNEEIKPYGRWAYLPELIDWNKVDFDKAINLEGYRKVLVESKWPLVKLGEICRIESGGTPRRNVKEFWNGDINWITSEVCKNDYICEDVVKEKITELGLNNSNAKIFPCGTVLIALVGATLGNVAYLTFESATNQNIAGIHGCKNVLPKYLFYFLKFLNIKSIFARKGYKMMSLEFVKNLKIPLPPIDIQKKIVEEIEKIENKQKKKKEIIENLKQKIRKITEELKKQSWKKIRLGDYIDVVIGGTPHRAKREYWENGKYLWVSVSDLNGEIIYDTKEKINDLGVKNSNVKLIKAGTPLVSFKLSIGRTGIAGKDLYTNEAIAGLVVKENHKEEIDNKFLFYLFKYKVIDLEEMAKTLPKKKFGQSLNKKFIENLKIPLPPIDIQKKIVEEIEKIENEIKLLEKEIKDAENKKKEILEKYLK